MITKEELTKEKEYLKKVLELLRAEIEKHADRSKEYSGLIKDNMSYTWDYDTSTDIDEWANNVMDLERKSITLSSSQSQIKAYTRMLKSAYFARIDFETEGEVLPIYIGIATLSDGTNFYVYDWRAPISSMFYDFEKGDASYQAPSGETIKGKIILKRQYKIENDKIVQIFDTDLEIVDDILKQMLEGNATDKMRNIVRTIQKEQNRVIRKKGVDILVVQGPAGSGKTSVAMHKIAYLLYSEKNNLSSSNILILSPNDIFSNYISSVLPDIGEDNVYQTTFMDFIRGQLTYKVKGTLNDLYEIVYSESPNASHSLEYNSVMLKYGAVYINLIERYLLEKRHELLKIEDVVVDGKVVVEARLLKKFADELEDSGATLYFQGKKIIEKVMLHMAVQFPNQPAIAQKIKKEMEANLMTMRARSVYESLYSDCDHYIDIIQNIYADTNTNQQNRLSREELKAIFNYTKAQIEKNTLPLEDVVGFLYLKERMHGSSIQSKIKYVLIDEAQDYTVMQYKILAHLFRKANITILGDLNQSIMPFASHQNYETIINLLKQGRMSVKYDMNYLTKTYRSTYEINMFAKSIIGDSNTYNQVDRHGDKVMVYHDGVEAAFKEAEALKQKYTSVAIITKTAVEASQVYDKVKDKSMYRLMTTSDKALDVSKILIIPSYLAKGLEFDAALVVNATKQNYPAEFKNLFYVCTTRALHHLSVYYTGTPTELISKEYIK